MMKKQIYILSLLLLTCSLAFGSGSGGSSGSGSSGGSAGSGGSGGRNDDLVDVTHASNYVIGKKIFFSQLHCATCPLAGLPLDKESIATIIPLLKSKGELGQLLSYRNRYAVKYFLKKRFGVK